MRGAWVNPCGTVQSISIESRQSATHPLVVTGVALPATPSPRPQSTTLRAREPRQNRGRPDALSPLFRFLPSIKGEGDKLAALLRRYFGAPDGQEPAVVDRRRQVG
ncbi:hypothetical protein ACFSX5_00725 [Devosia albogilva]|uniref:Uncharacterized protein n=1 Tax=Devosia albogilva TaxID=429726 RepID=A0ABW5QF49_9HYPH